MPSYHGGTAQRTDPEFLIARLMQNGYSRVQAAAIVYGDKFMPQRVASAQSPTQAAPPVSRETTGTGGTPVTAGLGGPQQQPAGARSSLRSGIASLGDVGAAYVDKQKAGANDLTVNPWSGSGILGGQAPMADGRGAIAETMTGQFPDGVTPMPAARPMTEPAMMQTDPLPANRNVAGMGSVFDPLMWNDYYG